MRLASLVGGVAALALLVQLVLAPPLALRMLALDSQICGDVGRAPGKMLHDHAQCPLCQAQAVSLGLVATGFARAISVAALRGGRQRPAAIRAEWFGRFYHARAPPVLC